MSPNIYSCTLCGYSIFDFENPRSASWITQCRILYSSQTQIQVTGVGFNEDPGSGTWLAPLDATRRWDEPGSACVQFGLFRQNPVDGRYGFPFHASCFSLLETAYSPNLVPYKALFEVCRSLPAPARMTGLSWGHDFGGLVYEDKIDRYQWEDRFADIEEDAASAMGARDDPYLVPEICQLLLELPEPPPKATEYKKETTTDCFNVLPPEVRMMIASQLLTTDAFNIRQASRSFQFIFYSQQFWASRFQVDAERSWLFEAQYWDKASDWRWLYHRTNQVHQTGGMRNRKRVWELIRQVQRSLGLRRAKPSAFTCGLSQDSLQWWEVTGDLRPKLRPRPYSDFAEGCRRFHEQYASVPSRLGRIGFSTVHLGDTEYIAGMRLVPVEGEVVDLGYMGGKELVSEITGLKGFNLAVGSRGVQGVQCILGDGQTSAWFGSSLDVPRTRRLAESGQLLAIKAGNSALWYPQVPGTDLYLNDDYFTARDISANMYQPLCWTMFGGPKGIYLRFLTGISATFQGVLHGIEFHYNSESVPAECRKVGRCQSFEYAKTVHFPVDGPGGEFIDSMQISTNRGRSYLFTHKTQSEAGIKRPIRIVPGSVITGMYWSQYDNGVTAIGAISA
ncbi:F-box domain-containing protein [Xylariomycetidae sp. FL2044]|nr:F-box domain-containing protein [Xylariomycetidae sp. FL2044]